MERRNCEPTVVRGVGVGITDVKEGRTKSGDLYANFLVRTEDGNIIRLQFWGEDGEVVGGWFPSGTPKGSRVGFRGQLRGTYDEKPSVSCAATDIRTEQEG